MEAVILGCIPVLPKRLSYLEFFPEESLYPSNLENPKVESECAFKLLEMHYNSWQNNKLSNTDPLIEKIPTWKNKKAEYQELINSFKGKN